jgi:hypothetical protein
MTTHAQTGEAIYNPIPLALERVYNHLNQLVDETHLLDYTAQDPVVMIVNDDGSYTFDLTGYPCKQM